MRPRRSFSFFGSPALAPRQPHLLLSHAVQIHCNGTERTVPVGMTVAGLLEELQLSPRMVAVELNLQIVPRALHAERALAEGDHLEIVSLVGGG